MSGGRGWRAPTAAAPVRARVSVPTAPATDAPDVAVAAAFAAAGLITGGTVLIRNWPDRSSAAETVAGAFADMGGYVVSSAAGLTVTGRSTSGAVGAVDLGVCDDAIAQILIAVAALADGPSRIVVDDAASGAVVADNLRRLGGRVDTDESGCLTVYPGELTAGKWESAGRADVALAGAVLGLVVDGLEVTDWQMVDSRYRGFTGEWTRMLAADEYLVPGSDRLPHEYLER
ncbi:3-phosphoshikimate 1-carboxyvinyltransferase [Gordonia insulae]|uniref:3-phosphoshikimate 1-carboxyvinyltransferase n=1 Tax=Gordonia insulae TaxID=2420509 RepID=A0A3G8JKE9_9ACTN|nr:hypothetical protein [Gordonia insulae]AZG44680.1 3-phosphoshikimate 1-carboxyvinyltransferase [Gordonia insulae]